MKAELAKMLRQNVFTLPSIRLSLRQSYKHVHDSSMKHMTKAELNKSVCRIAVKQLLDCVWKKRRETAGLLLKCVRAINNLHLSVNDLGERFTLLPLNHSFVTQLTLHRSSLVHYQWMNMGGAA